jgi:indole-3-glycerol phosphate synthase
MDSSAWVAAKREELKRLRVDARNVTPSLRDFTYAVSGAGLNVILELTRATPEEGPLAPHLDIAALARACDELDLSALAVATDSVVCGGSLADLGTASAASGLPLIQRDLILVRDQLSQARQHQADATVLSASLLQAGELKVLIDLAASMHMAAPVEVTEPAELDAALAAGARVLVVPAFDRERLSLARANALLPRVPRTAIAIVRGPFATAADLAWVRGKARAVWICGPFLRAADPVGFARGILLAAENT